MTPEECCCCVLAFVAIASFALCAWFCSCRGKNAMEGFIYNNDVDRWKYEMSLISLPQKERWAKLAEWDKVNGTLRERMKKKLSAIEAAPSPAMKPVDPKKIGLAVAAGVKRNK
jgi:hypothetical protein